jgi:hypothetical protein
MSRCEGSGQPPYAQRSGGFEVGSQYLLLLVHDYYYFEDAKPVDAWTVALGYLGNWEVKGDTAIGSNTDESQPLSDLKKEVTDAALAS